MTWEYITLGVVVFGGVIGYIKGFLSQISSLLGVFIGYIAARLFSVQLHHFMEEKGILAKDSSMWISFVITIILVIISIKFLSGLIENLLKSIGLNFTNRFAGMIFGAIKYLLILVIVFYFFYTLGIINENNASRNLIDFINLCKIIIKINY